ncbi:hypothetical protein M569_11060 [Genlisea aurea]|uniref:Uncharacterized protein n=1 Tax=Genlisea aurea TaxID=192259 RepID=S8C9X2_9LAMI|nr:hypothetical protein M569_11060 [Genlisea aurea]
MLRIPDHLVAILPRITLLSLILSFLRKYKIYRLRLLTLFYNQFLMIYDSECVYFYACWFFYSNAFIGACAPIYLLCPYSTSGSAYDSLSINIKITKVSTNSNEYLLQRTFLAALQHAHSSQENA